MEVLWGQTTEAERLGTLLANEPEVDMLLRIAGTRQISVAIREAGFRNGTRSVLVAAGARSKLTQLESQLNGARRVGGGELTSQDLERVEKAALLNLKRG